MHTTDAPAEIDEAVLSTLIDKVEEFVQNAHADLAKATLRVADIEIHPHLRDQYGVALRDALCSMYREWLYYVSVTEYTGRNGRHFADVHIEMRRGLLI